MTGSVDGHVRTYDLRKGELRSDFIGRTSLFPPLCPAGTISLTQLRSPDPVTAVVPTKDHQSYLVTTLDSHVRLMDGSTGKLLNDFEGHLNTSYRCRACFGFNEASVVCGDENGAIWAWDLLDVSIQVSLPTRAWSSPNLPLITVFFLLASVMKSGDRLAAEPAPEGPRESDHMDRVPSHRSWRDDHRQRRRCNQSLVPTKPTKMTKFERILPLRPPTPSSTPFHAIKVEITFWIEDRVCTYKRIMMHPENDN